jgi:hypothetical protein
MNKNVLACFLGCVFLANSLCLAIIAYFCVYKDAFYEKTSPFIIVLFSLISCTEDVSFNNSFQGLKQCLLESYRCKSVIRWGWFFGY